MVIIQSLAPVFENVTTCEIHMDSGKLVTYVAPAKYAPLQTILKQHQDNGPHLKMIGQNQDDEEMDKWVGVSHLCQCVDDAIEIHKDIHMFAGKRVLELGFCTGVPSSFAFEHGATSVALYCHDALKMNRFVKPTLRRNNVTRSCCKFITGDLENCKISLHGQKYDVILAPELMNTDVENFEAIHELLDAALAQNGIILISSRPYYAHCSGSLPTFLELVKLKGAFDYEIRWTPADSFDSAPRKVVQLMRAIR